MLLSAGSAARRAHTATRMPQRWPCKARTHRGTDQACSITPVPPGSMPLTFEMHGVPHRHLREVKERASEGMRVEQPPAHAPDCCQRHGVVIPAWIGAWHLARWGPACRHMLSRRSAKRNAPAGPEESTPVCRESSPAHGCCGGLPKHPTVLARHGSHSRRRRLAPLFVLWSRRGLCMLAAVINTFVCAQSAGWSSPAPASRCCRSGAAAERRCACRPAA